MSTATLNPIDHAQDFDWVTIDGARNPGIAEISGASRSYEWQVYKAQGTQGAETRFSQIPPAKFSIKLRFWLAEHFRAWATWSARLKYDPTKRRPGVFTIYYPTLADLGIQRCTTEEIGAITSEGKGLWSVTIKLLEYYPPKPTAVIATPNGYQQAQNDVGKGVDPAVAKLQQQAAKLAAQAQTAA